MDNKNLKEIFQKSERFIFIDKERKEKTLDLLREEVNKRKNIVLYDKKKIIKNQFIYMDKTALFFNIGGGSIMIALAYVLYNLRVENREVIVLYSVFASILSVLSLMGLSKIFSSNISELECSCYFNAKQMITLQMVSSGILNLTVLLIVAFIVGDKWEMAFIQVGLYIIVPFVYTQCSCLCMFLSKQRRQSSYMLFAVGIFSSVLCSVIAIIPQAYLISAVTFWAIAFIAGMLMLSMQIKLLFQEIEKGELICMN